jgi:hypothetical protein
MLSSGRWRVHRLSPAQLKLARLSFWAVLWSRVLVWEASAIAARVFGLARLPSAYNPIDLQPHGRSFGALLTFPVIRWDGDWYLAIARHGYALSAGPSPPRTNFFPLYPLLVGALERIGLPMALAAVAVSITSMWLALYALGRLVELELAPGLGKRWAHPDAAQLAVIALALSPVSFFLSSAYAESLFLALSVGIFLFARHPRARLPVLVLSSALLALLAAEFATWHYVA